MNNGVSMLGGDRDAREQEHPRPAPSVSLVVPKLASSDLGSCILRRTGWRSRPAAIAMLGAALLVGWIGLTIALAIVMKRESVAIVVVSALFLFPAGAFALWAGLTRLVFAVEVRDAALVRRDWRGAVVLPWTAIASVVESVDMRQGLFTKTSRASITFSTLDGRRIVIDPDAPSWLEIGRAASARAQQTMASDYHLSFTSRRRVHFGRVGLDAYGLHVPETSVPWSAIAFVRLEHASGESFWAVHLSAWSVALRVPTRDVANARVFVGILERLGKLNAPAPVILTELCGLLETG